MKNKHQLLTFVKLLIVTGLSGLVLQFAFAQDFMGVNIRKDNETKNNSSTIQTQAVSEKTFTDSNCNFAMPEKPTYSGHFLSITKKNVVAPDEIFKVQVLVQNTGNTPWFSADSGCSNGTVVNLGTEYNQDRISPFSIINSTENSWLSGNRIKMTNKRVSPLEIASFEFWAHAPTKPGLYREFFAPVAEGKTWMSDDAIFSTDIQVGETTMNIQNQNFLPYIFESTNLTNLDLSGAKNILVDLSEQTMWLKLGNTTIRTFPVSTGSYQHPTPPGKFKISLKQEVRVGGAKPHYIMPLFMMFKNGGYGIHALPSLANDRGVFWREALNHIGSPRSHGCIRLLPDDAKFVWDFTDLGTNMEVRR